MKRNPQLHTQAHLSSGMTLIELMLAMLLGLIVVGAAASIVLANKQSYRTNEALSQVQESARTAFELLARDIRQAGVSGCDNTGRVANVLAPGALWWQTWMPITGYDGAEVDPAVAFGSATSQRVEGTDSVQIKGADGPAWAVENHEPTSANLKVNAPSGEVGEGDILFVCDFDHTALFQVTNYNSSNVTVVHTKGVGSALPGNCSKGLGFPVDCASTNGNTYPFAPNSQVVRLGAVDWYIGNNGRADEGGRSLFRVRLDRGATQRIEEVVAGVSDLQIRYRLEGSTTFEDAGDLAAADWDNVNAVAVTLVMDSADRWVSTDSSANTGRLQRSFTNVITLRNRVP